jgi:hypothetical protein
MEFRLHATKQSVSWKKLASDGDIPQLLHAIGAHLFS